jgi:hypothetical protein
MTETSQRDPLADAFHQFRAEAPGEILAPGAAAVRHTVARRRRTRLAAVAALVAAGLTGIGYAAAGPAPRGAPPPPAATPSSTPGPTSSSTPGPTRGADQLARLGEQARARLGYKPGGTRYGMVFGPLETGSGGFDYALGTDTEPYPRGAYALRATCLGGGRATVSWIAGGRAGDAELACDGTVVDATLALSAPGLIKLRLIPDQVAAGRAGFAVAVSDPLEVRARNALGADGDGVLAAGSGFAVAERRDVDQTRYGPGDYTLEVACAGTGTLTATLTLGTVTRTGAVTCSGDPPVARIALYSGAAATGMTVRLEPDRAAFSAAGYSYRVRRG